MTLNKLQIAALLSTLASASLCWFSFDRSNSLNAGLSAAAILLLCVSPVFGSLRDKFVKGHQSDDSSSVLEYDGPTDTATLAMLLIAVGFMGLRLAFPVAWPAAAAFVLSFSLLTLTVSRFRPFKNLLMAIVAGFSLWPVAPEVSHRLDLRSEFYMSRLVSDRLDNKDILNFPEGRTVQTVKGNVELGRAGLGLTGIRSAVITACAISILMRRGPFQTIGLFAAGWFWAVAMNGFWAYGQALRISGVRTWESLWGISVIPFLAGSILILSTDQLLLVFNLLNPLTWIKREKKRPIADSVKPDSAAGENEEDESPVTSIPSLVFWGLGAASLVIAIIGAGQSIQRSKEALRIQNSWKNANTVAASASWPDRLGRWVKANANLSGEAPATGDSYGKYANSANYVANDRIARVSWIGPYTGWNERFLEYQAKGWGLSSEQVVSKSGDAKPFVSVQLSQPTGEKGALYYTMDPFNGETLTPSLRSFSRTIWWHFLQSMFMRGSVAPNYYLTEVMIESYSTPKEDELRLREELIRLAFDQSLPEILKSGK